MRYHPEGSENRRKKFAFEGGSKKGGKGSLGKEGRQ